MENKEIEVLSPAGDFETFKAAVNNGADAIYLGGKSFSARKNAQNFTNEEIIDAVKYAHLRNVKVYVTLNTLVMDNELEEVFEFIKFCYEANVDALIIQDLAVLRIVKDYFPDFPCHASTQMTISSLEGVKLAKEMGFSRVVLSRELSFEEIKYIADNTDAELEVFVHGALCVCYSGQCLLSSIIGSRSGNRGACAQPCRLNYNLIDYDGKKVFKDSKYLLSPKDLCLADEIEQLKKIGIKSLKIEGRMKNKEYVSLVTGAYSDAVKRGSVSDDTLMELENIFSRSGFTKAYFDNNINRNMLNFDKNNDLVYKNIDNKVLKKAEEMSRLDARKTRINAFVSVKKNKEIFVRLFDNENNCIEYLSNVTPQSANNAPLDFDSLKSQFSRLGDTAFCLDEFECEIDDNLFVSKKDLNEIRRQAVILLEDKILLSNRKKEYKNFEFCFCKNSFGEHKFTASVCTKEQLDYVMENEFFDKIFVPYNLYIKNKELLKNNQKIVCVLPKVIRKEKINLSDIKKVSISNIGQIPLCKNKEIYGEANLNITNSISLNEYKKYGLKAIMLSNELTLTQIECNKKSIDCEILVYGKIEVMNTKACIYKSAFGKCGCREDKFLYLEDRMKKRFPVLQDSFTCTSHIFNSSPLFMADKLNELKNTKVKYLRFAFTDENVDEIKNVIALYKSGSKCNFEFTRGHYFRGV
ncbi:MAG: U32 family peptidase [Ruminococcaceae bacterium]|nr:U32 family peptidase [Oscillospiraceae bacterium]